MTTFDVGGVCAIKQRLAILGQRQRCRIFDQAIGRGQANRRTTVHADGIPTLPFILGNIDREDDMLARPDHVVETREHTVARRVVPAHRRRAGCCIGNHQFERMPAGKCRRVEAGRATHNVHVTAAAVGTSRSADPATASTAQPTSTSARRRATLRHGTECGRGSALRISDSPAAALRLQSKRRTGTAIKRNPFTVG